MFRALFRYIIQYQYHTYTNYYIIIPYLYQLLILASRVRIKNYNHLQLLLTRKQIRIRLRRNNQTQYQIFHRHENQIRLIYTGWPIYTFTKVFQHLIFEWSVFDLLRSLNALAAIRWFVATCQLDTRNGWVLKATTNRQQETKYV